MSYLQFAPGADSASGKTKSWYVQIEPARLLGQILWYGPWRKYCFFPLGETVFDYSCLLEIAEFCNTETVRHRCRA